MDEKPNKQTTKANCGNCRFFARHKYDGLDIITDYGQCVRYPPKRINESTSCFPIVIDECFCGEWKKI
jgi:hypothetical protein